MANDYTTVSEIKSLMPDVAWSTSYDTALTTLITKASRAIDTYTNREPGAYQVTEDSTRYFDGSGYKELWISELAALPTTVSVAETGVIDNASGTGGTYTAWTTSDYYPWPYNALLLSMPFLRLDIDQLNGTKSIWYQFPKAVKVVGKFGYSTSAPADIAQATIIQTVRWFKRSQQAYQDTGAILELGQLQYVKALDPEVAQIISHYRRLTI